MTIAQLIEEIRILRMLNLDEASELEEQTLGCAPNGGVKPPHQDEETADSVGLLL
jgi:hypothetical protein